nr:MAG TPA: hypothetical protein [Caudoviricetes sp.]
MRLDHIFFSPISVHLHLRSKELVVEPSPLTLRSLVADYPIFISVTIP